MTAVELSIAIVLDNYVVAACTRTLLSCIGISYAFRAWRVIGHQAETSERRVQELEEQVRDLMFFLEAQKTIEAESTGGASELAGGNVEVVAKPSRGKKKNKRRG